MTDDKSNNSSGDPIDYDQWIEDALRTVARRALRYAEQHGLPGEHHFYITFLTTADGVEIPKFLLAQYPDEMTIVLQHQFEDLEVADDAFMVTLRFGGRPANLRIPFATVTAFTDPSVKFGLQYAKAANVDGENQAAEDNSDDDNTPESENGEPEKTGEVIALDAFRKK